MKENDKVRDTFYSEILDIIAAYETGLADEIKKEYEKQNKILSVREVENILKNFEQTHLFFGACKFHCFEDGNKRIAITLSAYFLLLNGYMAIALYALCK